MVRSNLDRYYLIGLSLALMMLSPLAALAWENEISHDLTPLSGIVLESKSGDALFVDMGSSEGLMVGDLLSIEEEGKKIIHPVTGKLMKKTSHIVSLLKVTEVRTDYSHVVVINGDDNVTSGKKVTRFSGLSALFIDRVGKGRNFYSNMSQTLPNLHWQGYRYIPKQEPLDNLPATDLVFILNNGFLQLEDQNRSPIRSYPVAAKDLQASIPKTSGLSHKEQIRQGGEALVGPDQGGHASKSINWEMSSYSHNQAFHFDKKFPGFDQIATLDEKVLRADFLEQENGLLLATTDGKHVRVLRFTDKLIPIAEYRSSAFERIHTIQWWQPGAKDELLLSVTASHSGDARVTSTEELTPSSFILKFHNDQLSLFKSHLNYFLGTFDRDNDGSPETLLGQYFDIDRFFGSVKRLEFQGDHLVENPAPDNIKKRLPVTQSLLADTTGNGQEESIYVRSGKLRIYQKETLLHSIDEVAGGSLSVVTYDKNPGQIDSLFETESFELPPVAVDIDDDSVSEVLVITSERTGLFSFGSTPDIKYSRIEILKNQDGRFLKGTLPKLPEVSIQGIYANKNRLFVVAVGQDSGEDKLPVSYLLSRSFTDKE